MLDLSNTINFIERQRASVTALKVTHARLVEQLPKLDDERGSAADAEALRRVEIMISDKKLDLARVTDQIVAIARDLEGAAGRIQIELRATNPHDPLVEQLQAAMSLAMDMKEDLLRDAPSVAQLARTAPWRPS